MHDRYRPNAIARSLSNSDENKQKKILAKSLNFRWMRKHIYKIHTVQTIPFKFRQNIDQWIKGAVIIYLKGGLESFSGFLPVK